MDAFIDLKLDSLLLRMIINGHEQVLCHGSKEETVVMIPLKRIPEPGNPSFVFFKVQVLRWDHGEWADLPCMHQSLYNTLIPPKEAVVSCLSQTSLIN